MPTDFFSFFPITYQTLSTCEISCQYLKNLIFLIRGFTVVGFTVIFRGKRGVVNKKMLRVTRMHKNLPAYDIPY